MFRPSLDSISSSSSATAELPQASRHLLKNASQLESDAYLGEASWLHAAAKDATAASQKTKKVALPICAPERCVKLGCRRVG